LDAKGKEEQRRKAKTWCLCVFAVPWRLLGGGQREHPTSANPTSGDQPAVCAPCSAFKRLRRHVRIDRRRRTLHAPAEYSPGGKSAPWFSRGSRTRAARSAARVATAPRVQRSAFTSFQETSGASSGHQRGDESGRCYAARIAPRGRPGSGAQHSCASSRTGTSAPSSHCPSPQRAVRQAQVHAQIGPI